MNKLRGGFIPKINKLSKKYFKTKSKTRKFFSNKTITNKPYNKSNKTKKFSLWN